MVSRYLASDVRVSCVACSTLGYLKGTEHVYKKYKTQLQRGGDPPCPLCHRPFDSPDEVDELVTEVRGHR